MKKFYILLIAMFLTAGAAYAQSNDSIERAKQQEALLKQQQKEQQELLKQQQKEQEALQKEQQKAAQKAQEERMKEQQKLQKEQQKEAEKAAKKEQDRIKREQVKAENKAKAEQKKAEKKRKRQEHYAAWGRHPNFTADPYVSIVSARRIYTKNSLYNSVGANVGVVFDYHRPIAKRWDFNVGIGYRFTYLTYSHLFNQADVDKGITLNSFATMAGILVSPPDSISRKRLPKVPSSTSSVLMPASAPRAAGSSSPPVPRFISTCCPPIPRVIRKSTNSVSASSCNCFHLHTQKPCYTAGLFYFL